MTCFPTIWANRKLVVQRPNFSSFEMVKRAGEFSREGSRILKP